MDTDPRIRIQIQICYQMCRFWDISVNDLKRMKLVLMFFTLKIDIKLLGSNQPDRYKNPFLPAFLPGTGMALPSSSLARSSRSSRLPTSSASDSPSGSSSGLSSCPLLPLSRQEGKIAINRSIPFGPIYCTVFDACYKLV
jgi:hypothetical protein